jgi:isopenicillin-N N-acyltransferase-like protein
MKEAKALKVIKCQGTDFEIGQQYGEICRKDFHWSIEWFHEFSQQYQISKEQIINSINEFFAFA